MSWCPSSRATWLGFSPRLLRMRRRSAAPAHIQQSSGLMEQVMTLLVLSPFHPNLERDTATVAALRLGSFAVFSEEWEYIQLHQLTRIGCLSVQQDGGDGRDATRAGQVQRRRPGAHPVAGGARAAARDLRVQRRPRTDQCAHLQREQRT